MVRTAVTDGRLNQSLRPLSIPVNFAALDTRRTLAGRRIARSYEDGVGSLALRHRAADVAR